MSAVIRISSYLLSEGDFISFVNPDVRFMTASLVSSLDEIESIVMRAVTVKSIFFRHWFGCVGAVK